MIVILRAIVAVALLCVFADPAIAPRLTRGTQSGVWRVQRVRCSTQTERPRLTTVLCSTVLQPTQPPGDDGQTPVAALARNPSPHNSGPVYLIQAPDNSSLAQTHPRTTFGRGPPSA